MTARFLIVLLGMIGFFGEARADLLVLRQEIAGRAEGDRIEVTTFLAETAADRKIAIERLRKSLAADRAGNAGLLTHFETVAETNGRKPNSDAASDEAIRQVAGEREVVKRVLPAETAAEIRQRYPNWFLDSSRTIFSVTRGVVNATVSTWSLMVSQHLPIEIALSAGVLTGSLSGGLQYFNAEVQKYLSTSLLEKLAKGREISKTAKFVESLFRWYAMEVGFVAAIQIALTALGHPPDGTVVHTVGANLATALKTVAAQGVWDIAVTRMTNHKMRLAKTPYAKKVVRMHSNLVTLGLSALAVTAMIGDLAGLSFGDTLFITLGATGSLYMVKVMHTEWKCRKNLTPAAPARGSDPLTEATPAEA